MEPEYIELTYISSERATHEQKSYLHIAYWAMTLLKKLESIDQKEGRVLREDEAFDQDFEFLMKKFIYMFILDIGISPFVKCYEGCNLIQGCIEAYRIDFLKELLMH